jgi:hypothetical protein
VLQAHACGGHARADTLWRGLAVCVAHMEAALFADPLRAPHEQRAARSPLSAVGERARQFEEALTRLQRDSAALEAFAGARLGRTQHARLARAPSEGGLRSPAALRSPASVVVGGPPHSGSGVTAAVTGRDDDNLASRNAFRKVRCREA